MIDKYGPKFPPDYYLIDCGNKYLTVIITRSEERICHFKAKKNIDRGDIVDSDNIEFIYD